MCLALPEQDSHQEAEDIHNRGFEVSCQERMQYYDECAKKV